MNSYQLSVNSNQKERKKIRAFPCFLWSKKTIFILLMFFMVNISAYSAEPAKIAIIGDTEKYQNEIDLLTVELSQDENVHLVERSDIDYILKEHGIALSKVSEQSLKIGQLIGADGLIIVKEISIDGKKFLSSRLISVNSAVIVDASVFPLETKNESANWAESIKWKFTNSFSKLDVSKSDKISISLLNIRAPLSNLLKEEKEFNTLLSHNLMMEKRIFVTERWNMGQVSFEKEVENSSSDYVTGKSLIEGSIETIDEKNIKITLEIKKEGEGEKRTVVLTGAKKDLAKLAKTAVDNILTEMNLERDTLSWNKDAESEAYFREAQWGLNSSLYSVASSSADSAWALGSKNPLLAMLRIKANGGELFNKTAFNPTRFDYGIQAHDIAPRMQTQSINIEPKRLDDVIYALEVYIHEVKKNPDFFRVNRVDATTLLKYSSAILKEAFEQKWNKNYKYSDKVTVLKYLTKKMFYLSMEQEPKSQTFNFAKQYFMTIFFHYIAYWNESVNATIADYKRVFNFDFNNDSLKGDWFKMKTKYILKQRSGESWTVDWNNNSRSLNDEFVRYVEELLSSENDEDIVNGTIIINNSNALKNKLNYSSNKIKDILIKNKATFINKTSSYSPYAILPLYCNDKTFLFEMAKEILKNTQNPDWAVIRKLLNKTSYSGINIKNDERLEFYNILKKLKQKHIGVFEESPTMKRLIVGLRNDLSRKDSSFENKTSLTDFLNAREMFELSNYDLGSEYSESKKIDNLLIVTSYETKKTGGKFVIIDIEKEEKMNIRIPDNIGNGSDPLDITGNKNILICVFSNGDIAKYDLSDSSWKILKKLPVSGYDISTIALIENTLLITFGPGYRNNTESNSGIFKLNIETQELELIASNRRLPAKTVLDNTPKYRIFDLVTKDNKFFMALKFIGITEKPYNIYEYDLDANKIKKVVKQFSWRGINVENHSGKIIVHDRRFAFENPNNLTPLLSTCSQRDNPQTKQETIWRPYYRGTRFNRGFAYNGDELLLKNDPNDEFNSIDTVNNKFGGDLNITYFAKNKKYEKIIPVKFKDYKYFSSMKLFDDGSLILSSRKKNNTIGIYKISKKEFDNFANKKLDKPTIFPTERDMHDRIYSTVHYFGKEQLITMSSNQDCEIRYTINGIIPNESSILYTEPFVIKEATEIKAKAFKEGYFASDFTKNIFKPEIANAKIYADWNNDGKETLAIQFYDTWERGVVNRLFIDNNMDGQFDEGYMLPRKMLKYSNIYLALKTDTGAELAIFNSKTLYYGDKFKKIIKYPTLSNITNVKGHNKGIAIFANDKWHIDANLDGKIEQ